MTTVHQRRMVYVQVADAVDGDLCGSPRLTAYGYRWIAEQAKMKIKAVRQAALRGAFDMDDPRSVCRWLDSREARAAEQRPLTDEHDD